MLEFRIDGSRTAVWYWRMVTKGMVTKGTVTKGMVPKGAWITLCLGLVCCCSVVLAYGN